MLVNSEDTYTFEEFLKISEKVRCEYINEKIYMMAAPSPQHQVVVGNVFFNFKEYFRDGECIPFVSPFEVVFGESNDKQVVQPDVLIVCDRENLKETYEGTPTLVVEVVSPSSSSRDYVVKLDLYTRNGVKEYWIIDPLEQNAIRYNLKDGKIESYKMFDKDAEIDSIIFPDLKVNLEEIFNF